MTLNVPLSGREFALVVLCLLSLIDRKMGGPSGAGDAPDA